MAQFSKGHEITLDYQQSENQISATVVLSNPKNLAGNERFDLVLVVPELVSLDIDIEGGKLSSKGLESAIKVRSERSDIQVKTSKAVDLFSKQGSIDLSIKTSDIKIQNIVQTHKGSVNVSYLTGMPYFEAITGRFTTSNSASLLQSLKKQGRSAFYGDKKDNRHIHIKSDTGQVSLIDLAL